MPRIGIGGVSLGGGGLVPASATEDPYIWLRADTGLSLSGSDVTAWADQSGNGHNFTAVATNEPTHLPTGSPASTPAVQFALATADYMSGPSLTQAQPITIIMAWRLDAWNSGRRVLAANSGDRCSLICGGSTPEVQMYSNSAGPITAHTVAAWYVSTLVFDGASSSLQVGDGTPATGNPGTFGLDAKIPRLGQFAGLGASFTVCEVKWFAAVLSSGQLADEKSTIATRWSISL